MGGLGGFGALFDLKAAGFIDPILIASTDGVGTKVKLAIDSGVHGTIGIDLVAMCVNDLIVQGGTPLFFLDYYATSRLHPEVALSVVAGIAEGCRQAGCALIGGETAEMPGLYAAGDYDLAGFAIGAVERDRILTGAHVSSGDVVLGISSKGLHSNGFSLVRKIVADGGYGLDTPAPFATDQTLAEALLAPTRIYAATTQPALEAGLVSTLANITGGGLIDNIPRVLPDGLGVRLDATAWTLPPVFGWLKAVGGLSDEELARTFNCGIGMVAIVPADRVDAAVEALGRNGDTVRAIGSVVRTDGPRTIIDHAEAAWRG